MVRWVGEADWFLPMLNLCFRIHKQGAKIGKVNCDCATGQYSMSRGLQFLLDRQYHFDSLHRPPRKCGGMHLERRNCGLRYRSNVVSSNVLLEAQIESFIEPSGALLWPLRNQVSSSESDSLLSAHPGGLAPE
jgi:hypothetical protein